MSYGEMTRDEMDEEHWIKFAESSPKQRRIVCAACRVQIGEQTLVVLGARHMDRRMTRNLEAMGWSKYVRRRRADIEDGFIDQYGVFHTREDAWVIAETANQIVYRIPSDTNADGSHKLWSENLY